MRNFEEERDKIYEGINRKKLEILEKINQFLYHDFDFQTAIQVYSHIFLIFIITACFIAFINVGNIDYINRIAAFSPNNTRLRELRASKGFVEELPPDDKFKKRTLAEINEEIEREENIYKKQTIEYKKEREKAHSEHIKFSVLGSVLPVIYFILVHKQLNDYISIIINNKQEEQKRVMSALVHHFKNYASVLRNIIVSTEPEDYIDIVEPLKIGIKNFEDAVKDLNNYMKYGRNDANKYINEQKAIFNINKWLDDFCMEENQNNGYDSIDINTDGISLNEVYIKATEWVLVDAMKNIFTNKYVHSKASEIYVYSFDKNGKIHIVISDNGENISEDLKNKFFEPYVKGNNNNDLNTSTEYPSSGLGTSIVKQAIELNGGKVRITDDDKYSGVAYEIIFNIFRKGK